jgi:hypothetical protein
MGSAVGACSVEGVDATSGVPDWERVRSRIPGWGRRQAAARRGERGGDTWRVHEPTGTLMGPNDGAGPNYRGEPKERGGQA